jgi:ATP-binding cassette subfamily B protein
MATIEKADQILVLDDGRIVQQGNHESLAAQEGVYRRFINIRKQAEEWNI